MTDYTQSTWSPNSNFFPDTGKKNFIIIHGTAGGSSAQGVANYFKGTEGTANPVSSHYIVDQAGNVIQCVLEKDGAFAQGVIMRTSRQSIPKIASTHATCSVCAMTCTERIEQYKEVKYGRPGYR